MLTITGNDEGVELRGIENVEYEDDVIEFKIGHTTKTPWNAVGGVEVVMERDPRGFWSATLSPFEKGAQIPWAVSCATKKNTLVVTIECPQGTPITVDGEKL